MSAFRSSTVLPTPVKRSSMLKFKEARFFSVDLRSARSPKSGRGAKRKKKEARQGLDPAGLGTEEVPRWTSQRVGTTP